MRAVRRTSGEIINATLLEVFLSIAFIVFALAVFEQQRADGLENKAKEMRATVAAMTDSLKGIRASLMDARAQADSIIELNQVIRALQFNSRFAPDCEDREGRSGDVPWVTVTIQQATLRVLVRTSRFGFKAGEEVVVSAEAFRGRFQGVRVYSELQGCRFPAQIVDTEGTSKNDYKRALAAVSTTFRLRGFLR